MLRLVASVCHTRVAMPKTPRPAPSSIAALLTQSQHTLGLTQETLGQLLGVSRTTMNRWQRRGGTKLLPSQLATLAGDFPDSRYVPCAVAVCPGAARPRKSAAPLECHPYIAQLRLGAGDGDK